MSSTDVVVRGDASGFAQEIVVGPHRLTADEPVEVGGKDTEPSPYDLLLAALGSCTSMTVAMYARAKKWPLESVTVNLRHSKIHAADCRDCETKEGKIDRNLTLASEVQSAGTRMSPDLAPVQSVRETIRRKKLPGHLFSLSRPL